MVYTSCGNQCLVIYDQEPCAAGNGVSHPRAWRLQLGLYIHTFTRIYDDYIRVAHTHALLIIVTLLISSQVVQGKINQDSSQAEPLCAYTNTHVHTQAHKFVARLVWVRDDCACNILTYLIFLSRKCRWHKTYSHEAYTQERTHTRHVQYSTDRHTGRFKQAVYITSKPYELSLIHKNMPGTQGVTDEVLWRISLEGLLLRV
jgi:hypothetical protein